MKRTIYCGAVHAIVLTCVSVNAVAQVAPAGEGLSLAQAVAEALERNNRVIDQRDSVSQADLNLRLAHNAFQPKITPNVIGSFGQTDISSQTYRVDVT